MNRIGGEPIVTSSRKTDLMHKRVLRQINRHLGIESESAIPVELYNFIDAISESYTQSDHNLELLSRTLDVSSSELVERNEKLTQTLDDLKKVQSQLVHSAKMAGLGELVAGVSHEINTPAGAIVNAIAEVKHGYTHLLSALTRVVQNLDASGHQRYDQACQVVINFNKELSTSEVRSIAKDLEAELQSLDYPDARSVSKNLAIVGFTKDNFGCLRDLLKTPDHTIIQQSLFDLGMSQTHVRNIQIAIGRIIHLVKALKLYSHSENNAFALSNLRDDINNTLIILHNKLKLGVEVVREFDEIPQVNCFADQLNQVWTNLINNAIDAMNGKGQIIIRLKNVSAHKIAVEVQDNGPGIPENIKHNLFTPYFTTKPKGIGTGLGLSISKEIVEKHKGLIDFDSKPGCTIFRVLLPIDTHNIGVN